MPSEVACDKCHNGTTGTEEIPFGLEGVPPEAPQPSNTAMIDSAIKRGDVQQLRSLMDGLGSNEDKIAEKAIERLTSKAEQVIAKECRGSINREFPGEMKQKTLEEIYKLARSGNDAATKAKKLLNDGRFKK